MASLASSPRLPLAVPSNFSSLWRNLAAMGGSQMALRIVRLGGNILISRHILPEHLGKAAVIFTAYELISLFTRNGITSRLVQATPEELPELAEIAQRLLWWVCFALMTAQIAIAATLGWAFADQTLGLGLASMSLIYLATPLTMVQVAMQQREGHMGRLAIAGPAQLLADQALTLVFLFGGLGPWGLILPKILVAPIWVLLLRYGHAWRPQTRGLTLNAQDRAKIMPFAKSVLGVELQAAFQAQIDNIFVMQFFGLKALGFYYFAFNNGLGLLTGFISASAIALYPHFCRLKDSPDAFQAFFLRSAKYYILGFASLMFLQISAAPYYVPAVFGTQWQESVPLLIILCLSGLMRPSASLVSTALKAQGNPKLELHWQMFISVFFLVAIAIASQINPLAIAWAICLTQTIGLFGFTLHGWKVLSTVTSTAKTKVLA